MMMEEGDTLSKVSVSPEKKAMNDYWYSLKSFEQKVQTELGTSLYLHFGLRYVIIQSIQIRPQSMQLQ